MTPVFTVNLLLGLFVTFCGEVGSLISSELLEQTLPGLLVGVLLGLIVVLLDRLLKGVSLRAVSSATFGLFLSRALIVPRFVLTELQALADSREPVKRERGRRGLDILNQLQRSREIELTIHESESGEGSVDERLVRTAKVLQARLLTNDNSLCQVARLQQVGALNLNDLTRALRPIVLAGDEMELHLVKEGRDPHQAVGYLPDGTMIVINHARSLIGKTVKIVVSSTLQTAGGRLIFGELKPPAAASA